MMRNAIPERWRDEKINNITAAGQGRESSRLFLRGAAACARRLVLRPDGSTVVLLVIMNNNNNGVGYVIDRFFARRCRGDVAVF